MEYVKLTLEIVLLVAFVFIFIRNIERKGFIHSLLRVDTIAGIVVGGYLVTMSLFTSSHNAIG